MHERACCCCGCGRSGGGAGASDTPLCAHPLAHLPSPPIPPPTQRTLTKGWALCGHEAPAGLGGGEAEGSEGGGSEEEGGGVEEPAAGQQQQQQQQQEQQQQQQQEHEQQQQEGPWQPRHALSRAARVAAGERCKRLLDALRARWLASQGFVLGGEGGRGVLAYVPPQVSGENRLLLGVAPRAGVGV